MIFIIESRDVEPGTEEKLDVPVGTKTVFYSWKCVKSNDYSPFGVCGKGLTPNMSITDLLRMICKEQKKKDDFYKYN